MTPVARSESWSGVKLEIELSDIGGTKSLESWVSYSAAIRDVSEKRFVEAVLEAVRRAHKHLDDPAEFGAVYAAALTREIGDRR